MSKVTFEMDDNEYFTLQQFIKEDSLEEWKKLKELKDSLPVIYYEKEIRSWFDWKYSIVRTYTTKDKVFEDISKKYNEMDKYKNELYEKYIDLSKQKDKLEDKIKNYKNRKFNPIERLWFLFTGKLFD